ncbi:glycosyltransferase family 4 protein [Spirosoma montaniterrae]|uniref:Glycosyl transferase family 1 n=1 Tax=Spirosoma montaniterrae TaxID=1178516 RepID=A0A1P9X218_9BACT|nr:glycosyltransferase family 1 protein [Spirosoma montaniterrae]AQG81686.1 hypothetical protein AWR27_21690 [Spirosoma montaniterrae]
MTVFFDNQAFYIQEYGGLSRYFAELIAGLHDETDIQPLLSNGWTNNQHLRNANLTDRSFFAGRSFRGKIRLMHRMNRWHDAWQLRQQSYDLFHATYYDTYFLAHLPKQTPLVVTFLDMIHEKFSSRFPELAQDKMVIEGKRLLARRANRLIAISESTKRDVVELLDVDPAKIDVVHLGSSFSRPINCLPTNSPVSKVRPYLLYVGMRAGYKNWAGLVEAIHPLLKQEQIQLVCVGSGPFNYEEQTLLRALDAEKWVVQQEATDQKLGQLYQHAVAFFFPSLYEGFGIPVLEAFACGCPCLLSNSSSLPEVAGDAALYFDPDDADSIRTALQTVISDQALRARLIQQGQQRATLFTWSAMQRKTADIYRKCVS